MMAHSRGSGIAVIASAAFRHRVCSLLLFDSTLGNNGSYPANYEETGPIRGSLERVIQVDQENRRRSLKVFDKIEDAVRKSVAGDFPKSWDAAERITKRHLKPTGNGKWVYCHDARTYKAGK